MLIFKANTKFSFHREIPYDTKVHTHTQIGKSESADKQSSIKTKINFK